jgi:hypothetical protein
LSYEILSWGSVLIVAEVARLCEASTVPAATIKRTSGKFRIIEQKYELCIVDMADEIQEYFKNV